MSALDQVCTFPLDLIGPEGRSFTRKSLCYYESKHIGFRVPAGLQLADIEFRDRIPPICREVDDLTLIGYPIYYHRTKVSGETCLAITAPYLRVLGQLVRDLRFKVSFEFLTLHGGDFAKFLEKTFGGESQNSTFVTLGEFVNVSIRVKSAVLPLKVAAEHANELELRRVVLTGENIFRTKLYQRLRSGKADGNKYELSGARVTLLYSDDLGKGVATTIAQHGAFAFRPGLGGENMEQFSRLMEFLSTQEIVEFGKNDPLDYLLEDLPNE